VPGIASIAEPLKSMEIRVLAPGPDKGDFERRAAFPITAVLCFRPVFSGNCGRKPVDAFRPNARF
jgi:hypothetical protein